MWVVKTTTAALTHKSKAKFVGANSVNVPFDDSVFVRPAAARNRKRATGQPR